jgi:hypothetical protein
MSALLRILSRPLVICATALVMILPCPASGKGIHNLNPSEAYAQKIVAQLIDELVQIDSPASGIDSAAVYEGFIAEGTSAFDMGVLGIPAPKVPVAMRELVRRGPLGLAELVRHVDDKRSTRLQVGNIDAGTHPRHVGVNPSCLPISAMSTILGCAVAQSKLQLKEGGRDWRKTSAGAYTVKVRDICFVLIGQL